MSAHATELPRRATLASLCALNACGLLLIASFVHGELNEWGGDNVDFLVLARALAEGEGYVDLHLAGHPPHTHYPPLFPALLALLVRADASLVVCKWFVALCSLAGLNLALVLLARSYGLARATLVCLATLCSGVFLDPALSVMSDGPYLLLSLAALLASAHVLERKDAGIASWIGAGALIGLSTLTRTVGFTLVPALAASVLFGVQRLAPRTKLRRAAVAALATSALVGPWLFWSIRTEGTGRDYVEQLLAIPEDAEPPAPLSPLPPNPLPLNQEGRVRPKSHRPPTQHAARTQPRADAGKEVAVEPQGESENQRASQPPQATPALHKPHLSAATARTLLGRPFSNARDLWLRLYYLPPPTWLEMRGFTSLFRIAVLTLALGLACIGVIGVARAVLVGRAIHDYYVAVYLILLTFWVGGGPRLFVPILPFLMAYVVEGASWVASTIKGLRPARHGLELVAFVLMLLLSLSVTFLSPRMYGRLTGEYPHWWLGLQEASRFLGEKNKPNRRILTQPASVPYYVAGLQSVTTRPGMETTEHLRRQILESRADFVIVTRPYNLRTDKHLERVLRTFPNEFELVREFYGVRIYRVRWRDVEKRWGLRR